MEPRAMPMMVMEARLKESEGVPLELRPSATSCDACKEPFEISIYNPENVVIVAQANQIVLPLKFRHAGRQGIITSIPKA